MINSNILLYLRLGITHQEDYLNAQLQQNGFKLVNKTGKGVEVFRNYDYEMKGAPGALKLSLKFMPGKRITRTVSISLSPDIHQKHVKRFFDHLSDLVKLTPFKLLDLQKRNEIYKRLHEEGKVDAFYVGLNKEEQLEIEKQAYIELEYKTFLASCKSIVIRDENEEGERAPDLDV
ncbi:MAG: hypothetical protein AB8F74_15835 [Saprospiraceae bacterium]